jgi:Protein of unknown function (DUF1553)/Protein of unknown function (DUF1549)/Planctomycete cytochrome C
MVMFTRALSFCFILIAPAAAQEAAFHRAINLNGPSVTIEGRLWEAADGSRDFSFKGKTFENQTVVLRPAASAALAQMIRSSVWGDKVELTFTGVPAGPCQVFVTVWEDNNNEKFDILVNGAVVVEGFNSGSAGMWKRLGPFPAESKDGQVNITSRAAGHAAANFSGVELWLGRGPVPEPEMPKFATETTPEQAAFFEQHIRPVLVENCYECHSAGAKKIKGGLLLDSRAGVHKGGDSGRAITPGDAEGSLLMQALRHVSEDVAMPPKKKLPPEVIGKFAEWVRMGAPDPRTSDTLAAVKERAAVDWSKAREWWSFRPIVKPPLPAVKSTAWPRNDLDRFILAKLEAAGLEPAPDAAPLPLLRRMSYDLTGLPPEMQSGQPDLPGYINRLLASPRYGERWGRHWLDVVRYADTAGDNSDFPIPQMRRYRDWVIDAINRDLPYDQFVREQLAGDLLGGEGTEQQQRIIATGYIANARRFGSRVDDYPQHLTIEDTLDNIGRTFLGLSVNCARCHDHKFDPIPTQDYYALYGILSSTRYPWPGIELEQRQRDLVPLVPPDKLPEMEKAKRAREEEIGRLEKEVQTLKDALKSVPEPGRKAHEDKIKAAERAASGAKEKPKPYELAYAVAESPRRGDAVVQIKGDPAKPGETVPRRWLTVFGGQPLPEGDASSGRRTLAEWITAKDNPLAARVMVNRVWHYHFGRGLVPTPNDFGKQGKPCSHPELLDYLAAWFMENGWSVKALHREIMGSRTYQMSTARSAAALEKDANNELLSSFPRRRMDAESLRDTLLLLGGTLNLERPGEHPFPPESEWKFTQHNPFKAIYGSHHRSVYLMTQRIQRHPYLAVFDGADPSTSTPARPSSTTPLQALYFLNDPVFHEQSRRIAERVLSAGPDVEGRVREAYRLILCRPPEAEEVAAAEAFLQKALPKVGLHEPEAWASYVRVLLRLNEFLYLE